MAKINLDGEEYELDALSSEAKAHLTSIRFCDAELGQLQAEVAALQTARMAYVAELKGELAKIDRPRIAAKAPEVKIEPPQHVMEAPSHHQADLIEQPFIDLSGPPSYPDAAKPEKKSRLLGKLFKK